MDSTQLEEESSATIPSTLLVSEPLTPSDLAQMEIEDASPEAIFLRAVEEIPTQPLPLFYPPVEEPLPWSFLGLVAVAILSFVGGAIIGILTAPSVTVELVPVSKRVTLSTQLALPTRTLAPVTITRSESTPTTGHGHQDARAAEGVLTLYNGLFSAQTIPAGTVFKGSDGIKVTTEQAVTVPPGHPPSYGEATVFAQALSPGAAGNIQTGDIDATVAPAILVKSGTFHGGRDARDYRIVAQHDLDALTTDLQRMLTQAIPQAFPLAPREAVVPTHCVSRTSADHGIGQEATAITVKATSTCQGMAYNQDELEQQATEAFTSHTRPGVRYQLASAVQVSVTSVSPVTVSCRGLWVYTLTEEEEQALAEQIAGDSPQQAQRSLLHTGFITRASLPRQLPKDPGQIHFVILIGL